MKQLVWVEEMAEASDAVYGGGSVVDAGYAHPVWPVWTQEGPFGI